MRKLSIFIATLFLLIGCSLTPDKPTTVDSFGQWIVNDRQQPMVNPQTSGLVAWRDGFLTLSDRSAEDYQQQHIHFVHPSGRLVSPSMAIKYSKTIQNSCFANYIMDKPDLEALAVVPGNDKQLVIVTEDASYATLSADCQERYGFSGSTPYPTLLVKLDLQADNTWLASGIRPLFFTDDMTMGNYPNDGFEGLVFGPDNQLYLALEKDGNGQPRIFNVVVSDGFWQTQDYVLVNDPKLLVPTFDEGRHPINGMTLYQDGKEKTWLIAAARNDDQLWLIDTAKTSKTRVINVNYWAKPSPKNDQCRPKAPMFTSGIEGVTVRNDKLWLINDPWKENYLKNIQCLGDTEAFESYSPLLFSIPLNSIFYR